MLRVAPHKSEPKKKADVVRISAKRVLFPGLVADAKALGVHRNHLYLVLSGRRKSGVLLARYDALQRSKQHGR